MNRQEMQSPVASIESDHIMNEEEDFRNSPFYLKCQLIRIFDGAAMALNIFDKTYLKMQRLKSALVRRIRKAKKDDAPKKLVKTLVDYKQSNSGGNKESDNCEPFNLEELSTNESSANSGSLKAGDLVEVLPLEEIQKLLNEKNETKGLAFLPSMYKFCGTRARVMKRIHYIFDERARVMRKVKNVVLLEGVICDGEGMFDAENCDRGCFLFWKDTWLRKIPS